jgi:DNA repair exonuclease SbcCD ATPase subunit
VKVNPDAIAGKENVPPVQVPNSAKEAEQEKEEQKRKQELLRQNEEREAEELRRAEEEAQRKRELEEREAECLRQEEHRRQEEQLARERQAAEAAERLAAEHEENIQREKQEKLQQEEELAAQKADAQRLLEERSAAQATVDAWCRSNGFVNINAQKKSLMSGTRFPLHEAVSKRNEEIVTLMVKLGVDKSLKNSKWQTAEELAKKMNKNGSMDSILVKLS